MNSSHWCALAHPNHLISANPSCDGAIHSLVNPSNFRNLPSFLYSKFLTVKSLTASSTTNPFVYDPQHLLEKWWNAWLLLPAIRFDWKADDARQNSRDSPSRRCWPCIAGVNRTPMKVSTVVARGEVGPSATTDMVVVRISISKKRTMNVAGCSSGWWLRGGTPPGTWPVMIRSRYHRCLLTVPELEA